MFEISLKMPKSHSTPLISRAKLDPITAKKPSKLPKLFRSFFYPKSKSSNDNLGSTSTESILSKSVVPSSNDKMKKESTGNSTFLSKLASSSDNEMMTSDSVLVWIRIFHRIAREISIGLGIFGGLYAFYRIYFLDIDPYAQELEMLEFIPIVY